VDALVLSLTVRHPTIPVPHLQCLISANEAKQAEAPDEVVDAFANDEPGPMTDAKRAEFLKLRALIDRALRDSAPAS
jgi:hypothetical protein